MHRLSYKSLFIIIAFLLIPIIFLLRLQQKPSQVLADWFNDAWTYRQAINISSHTTGETNVYIVTSVNIGTTAKAQSDDGDFRFTTATGQLLDYYIVSGTGTTNVTFHIKFDSFPAGAQTVYAYYGNPSTSNGFSITDFSTLATSYAIGSTSAEETGGGPVAYWKFDEGVGTTVYDATSNHINGGFGTGSSSPTWSDESKCINGKCLKYNGSNYVDFGDVDSLDYSTSSFSFSAWFKTSSLSSFILNKRSTVSSAGYDITAGVGNVPGDVYVRVSDGSTTHNSATWSGTNDSKWHLVVGVLNKADNTLKIYGDDKLIGSVSTVGLGSVSNSTQLQVGCRAGARCITGFVDDVKIYPYARTATQIKQDYTSGIAGMSSAKGSNSSFGGRSPSGSLSDGLVGYWKMDEGIGTTTADSSGNNNLATFTGATLPSWSTGKYGTGTSLSTGQYSAVTNPASGIFDFGTGDFSTSAWVKMSTQHTGNHAIAVAKNVGTTGFLLIAQDADNSYYPSFRVSNASVDGAIGNATIYDGNWHHLVGTRSGSTISLYVDGVLKGTNVKSNNVTTATGISLGNWNANSNYDLNGSLDEVRIYNRALNPNEVKALYDYAPNPIIYFPLNEKNGTSVSDTSGNNIVATFNSGTSAPSWANGKYGSGLQSNSTYYTGADFTIPTSISRQFKDKMSVSLWYKDISSGYIFSSNGGGFLMQAAANNVLAQVNSTSGRNSCTSSGTILSDKKWHHLNMNYDGTAISLYIDGIFNCSGGTSPGDISGLDVQFRLGGRPSLASGNGIFDEIKYYNYARTQEQIIQDMQGSSRIADPIAYYKFDEGQGSILNNSGVGTSILNLSFGSSVPSWTTDSKNNKGLLFNGIGGYITRSDHDSLDLHTGGVTASAWVKAQNPLSSHTIIVSKGGSSAGAGGYWWGITTTGKMDLGISDGTNYLFPSFGNSPSYTTVTDNRWHHLAFTWDPTQAVLKYYIDGKLDRSIGTTASSVDINSNTPLLIGGYTSNAFTHNGFIDEVKIYNYALSQDEVKLDYNQGNSATFSTSSQTIGATTTSLDYCIPGDTTYCAPPVGAWKFEEGVGITAFDTSGNNNHGVLGSGSSAPIWDSGKMGKALSFDGIYDTVSIPDPASGLLDAGTGSFSYSFWVNTSSSVGNYDMALYKGGASAGDPGYDIELGTGAWTTNIHDGTTAAQASFGSETLNQWVFLSAVIDRTSNKLYAYKNGTLSSSIDITGIGSLSNSKAITLSRTGFLFKGKLDDIRTYNYARTPAQVAYDYNKGGPIGWWRFDECQGNIANSINNIGLSGSINIGLSGTQTSLGTCTVGTSAAWTNGASGKYNSSLNLDGTDDYVNVGDPTSGILDFGASNFSTSAWIKTTYSGDVQYFVQKGATSLGVAGYSNRLNTTGAVHIRICDGLNLASSRPTATSTRSGLNDGNWHHIVTVNDRQSNLLHIFIDGNFDSSTDISSIANNSVNTASSFQIGRSDPTPFNGQIDDVQIFNYALTPTQIKTLYSGSSAYFK